MAQFIIDLDEGQDFSIIKQRPKEDIFPFTPIGRYSNMYGKNKGFDASEVFKNLSTPATWMFWELVSDTHRDRHTNVSILKKSTLSKEHAARIQRGYSELESACLIVRISNNTYLINPKAILPELNQCQIVWLKWKEARHARGLPD